jgi:hypothetical protein
VSLARAIVIAVVILAVGIAAPVADVPALTPPVGLAAAEDCIVVNTNGNVTFNPPGCVPH